MKKMVEDVREFFELSVELKKECSSEIEGYGQAFVETVNKYSSEMERMKTILVGLMAKNLGIDQDKFIDLFKDGLQSMRLNYYPPCPDPSKVLGISPHSDATGITILLQLNEVDGPQIRHGGNWVPFKIIHGALLVNIG
ncbi:hypothetical protein Syun_025127 [Stephania yunnanensis]|uniref:Fe2OG dioxygenase domain-containing protein n=1 Tax=Stephania yunnanensis TaxID=152371 RepID=A0AAP0HUL3_9MAGN